MLSAIISITVVCSRRDSCLSQRHRRTETHVNVFNMLLDCEKVSVMKDFMPVNSSYSLISFSSFPTNLQYRNLEEFPLCDNSCDNKFLHQILYFYSELLLPNFVQQNNVFNTLSLDECVQYIERCTFASMNAIPHLLLAL